MRNNGVFKNVIKENELKKINKKLAFYNATLEVYEIESSQLYYRYPDEYYTQDVILVFDRGLPCRYSRFSLTDFRKESNDLNTHVNNNDVLLEILFLLKKRFKKRFKLNYEELIENIDWRELFYQCNEPMIGLKSFTIDEKVELIKYLQELKGEKEEKERIEEKRKEQRLEELIEGKILSTYKLIAASTVAYSNINVKYVFDNFGIPIEEILKSNKRIKLDIRREAKISGYWYVRDSTLETLKGNVAAALTELEILEENDEKIKIKLGVVNLKTGQMIVPSIYTFRK